MEVSVFEVLVTSAHSGSGSYRMFDHWAHLGGAAFGAIYWKYGPSIWDALRADIEDEDEDVKLKNN